MTGRRIPLWYNPSSEIPTVYHNIYYNVHGFDFKVSLTIFTGV